VTFYYCDSKVVEWVIDLIFVQKVGRAMDFDFEFGVEVID